MNVSSEKEAVRNTNCHFLSAVCKILILTNSTKIPLPTFVLLIRYQSLSLSIPPPLLAIVNVYGPELKL